MRIIKENHNPFLQAIINEVSEKIGARCETREHTFNYNLGGVVLDVWVKYYHEWKDEVDRETGATEHDNLRLFIVSYHAEVESEELVEVKL